MKKTVNVPVVCLDICREAGTVKTEVSVCDVCVQEIPFSYIMAHGCDYNGKDVCADCLKKQRSLTVTQKEV